MTENATLSDLYLGIAKEIQSVDTTMPLILKGMPIPSIKEKEEWLAWDFLSVLELGSQSVANKDQRINLQLSCFSLHGQHRQDKKVTRPYELADIYRPLLHRKSYVIKSTCIRLQDVRIVYLDLKSSGDFAKQIYQNSPSLQTHSAVLYTTAIVQ